MLASSKTAAVLLAAIAILLLSSLLFLLPTRHDGRSRKKSVQIVVLGDIGRSPRMQYHAISLAKHGAHVDLIGFKDSDVHPDITKQDVNIVRLNSPAQLFQTRNRLLFLILGPLKVVLQSLSLLNTVLYRTSPPSHILVQNPPSIPVLLIASLSALLRNSTLVIDWHNYGYSVLALKLGSSHPLVRISRLYESFFGRVAHAHLCVTHAMARDLTRSMGVEGALALHDRPSAIFRALTSEQQRREVWRKLEVTRAYAARLEDKRTRLVVSSTSWTPDEDFGVLLDAFARYSASVERESSLPDILAIITGKGPQKEMYLKRIAEMHRRGLLQHIHILTTWLSMEDYASLLAAADLGVCLHMSTSGVDLPMKVVDMFGAGLPVVGYDGYESWPELVKEGENGFGFKGAEDLEALMLRLFGAGGHALETIRRGAREEGKLRWDDEWDRVAGKQVFRVV